MHILTQIYVITIHVQENLTTDTTNIPTRISEDKTHFSSIVEFLIKSQIEKKRKLPSPE